MAVSAPALLAAALPEGVPGEAGLVAAVARAARPWSDLYSDSTALSIAILFVHLAAMLLAGGLALAADRGTLRAARAAAGDARARHLGELAATHRPVVAALGAVLASGALLALADVEAYAGSPVFWGKMALVGLLLANGFLMTRAEQALGNGGDGAWGRLRRHALASAALWLVVVLAGTALANV
jgi:hypothetical protein